MPTAEYGASKSAWAYALSVDNKARYCALHQYDLKVDVATGENEGKSNRFRKIKLLRELWDDYDWLIWMDLDAVFVDPMADVMQAGSHKSDSLGPPSLTVLWPRRSSTVARTCISRSSPWRQGRAASTLGSSS